jgi:tripartite-type tricarboxylate transporter receptor subunit TctC
MKLGCALLLLALAAGGAACAEEPYPTRPLRLVVGFGAGGPTDIPARFVADKLGEALGQRVIVENKPAAAGMIAARDVLSQPRDGYTLLLCTHFEPINTAVYKNAQFKLSDLAPVSLIAKYYYGLALANAVPADDFEAFVQYAKAHPGEVSYATIGAGSAQEILARQLEKLTGIAMNRIPFRGGAQVVQELVAGRVQFYVSPTLAIVPQYEAKQLKILAVSAQEPRRHPDADRARRRLRALRLARGVRRRRHAAADPRPAAAPDRRDHRLRRVPRDDREGRLHRGVVDGERIAAGDGANARRCGGEHPRI